MDGKMDTTDDSHMEEMKMETESKQMTDNDFFAGLSDVTHKRLTIGEGPSSSCRKARVKSRPKLQWTKSFPPYSQCIGGLGENENWSNELISETDQQYFSPEEEERNEGTERKDVDMERRCSRDELRAKWRSKRKERLWVGQGSNETGADKCDRGRWSGKRRVEETGGDGGDDKGNTDGEWKHCRSLNSSLETEIIEEVSEQRERSPISEVEGDNMGSLETLEGQDDKTEEMVGTKGTPTTPQRSSPHPILSKLLHSSSSTSSCSSTNLSSAESDEVFSDTEDVSKKRRTLRKSRSWKTFLTMMHWSLRRQSSWVQLAGHQGNFQLSEGGEVLKLYSEVEAKCLDCLMTDPLRPFVPQYHGMVTRGEQCFIRMEDLLSGLRRPVIMDCKMGVRTYQEEELIKARTKATMRSDMYFKMLKIDPSAPSPEEHAQKGVTKCRYLQWRDTTSSTSTLGFRIEGIMMEDGSVQRDFRKIMTLAQVTDALLYFTRSQLDILKAYHSRLLDLSQALTNSPFFRSHEVIGSSLLFVHDHSSRANVWMIDFGKTTPVPDMNKLRHNVPWAEGSREDGYLIGLMSLITSLSQAIRVVSWQQEGSSGEEKVLPEAD